jgi:hypothetical protein
MEQSKKRSAADVSPERRPTAGRRSNVLFFAALAGAVVLALFVVWWLDAGQSGLSMQRLVGRWQRTDPDGKFILEVRKVNADGTVEARYFNPNPINVAAARASMEDVPGLFVELRDVNYPGSTYTLSYDPANDELVGGYFQPGEQQTYDVIFKRQGQLGQ